MQVVNIHLRSLATEAARLDTFFSWCDLNPSHILRGDGGLLGATTVCVFHRHSQTPQMGKTSVLGDANELPSVGYLNNCTPRLTI